ncbi:MAG TPA: SAM-dependent methyltransferase [Clostridia bacterium]|nr:SAM-dependent methyltransferase [Clostridia bacterium]
MENSVFVITASAQYFNQGLSELQEIDGSVRVVKLLENGVAIIETKLEKLDFIQAVKAKKPVFIRHMNAVDYIIDLEADGPQKTADAVKQYRSRISEGQRIAVQVRKGLGDYPYSSIDVKSAVDAVLTDSMGAIPEVKEPEQIISILLWSEKCCIGLGTPDDNISDWSGGMIHYKKSENDVSRAKYKLMEAIEVFNIEMGGFRYALDLGAAPGGWTSVLLEHGLQVTAVDTGDMDARLFKYPNFKFIKANAAELELKNDSFDLMTSDISWNPKNTARLINNASVYLKSGGTAVITLKLMGDKVRKTIKEVLTIYKEVFEVLAVKQLFHNREEVTLYLKKG